MIEAKGCETKDKYAVGCNMPGYMPDSEPSRFTNYRDALACFAEDTERAIGDYIDEMIYEQNADEGARRAEIDELDAQLVADRNAALRNKKNRKERSMKIGVYRYWLEFI